MSSTDLVLLLLLDIVVAFLIAKYQQNNGYTFYKSFAGALIGMIGLTMLAIKGWNAL